MLCVLGIVGCGVQGGRFVTTGSKSNSLSSNVGCVDIVVGYEKKTDRGEELPNEQNLLYVLIVAPEVQEHGSSSSNDYGRYVTTLNRSWSTDKGTVSISIPWNRQTDTVTIGKQDFSREKGNVFVVQLNPDGQITGKQLPSLGAHSNFTELLDYINKQLPTEELFSSLRLSK